MSNKGPLNATQDPWSVTGDWQIVRSQDRLLLDELGLSLLDLSPDDNPPSAQSLALAGPRVSLRNGEVSCGEWIADCFNADNHDAAVMRCATDNYAMLDAGFDGSTLNIRTSPVTSQSRQLRHDFANRINNIHVNAQLIRLWGRQRDDDPLQDASQRILDECSQALEFAQDALGAIGAERGPLCDVAATLPGLLFNPAKTEPALAVAVRHSIKLQSSALLHIAHFLNRVAQETARPLHCCLEPLADAAADESMELTIKDEVVSTCGPNLVQQQWHDRGSDQLALPNMAQSTSSFSLACKDDTLQLALS